MRFFYLALLLLTTQLLRLPFTESCEHCKSIWNFLLISVSSFTEGSDSTELLNISFDCVNNSFGIVYWTLTDSVKTDGVFIHMECIENKTVSSDSCSLYTACLLVPVLLMQSPLFNTVYLYDLVLLMIIIIISSLYMSSQLQAVIHLSHNQDQYNTHVPSAQAQIVPSLDVLKHDFQHAE